MVDCLGFIPYEPHRRAILEMLREVAAQSLIIGALLIGSWGRWRASPSANGS